MNEEQKVTFVDKEGNKILGGSILDLQKNTEAIQELKKSQDKHNGILLRFWWLGLIALTIIVIMIIYIDKYDMLTNTARLIGGG